MAATGFTGQPPEPLQASHATRTSPSLSASPQPAAAPQASSVGMVRVLSPEAAEALRQQEAALINTPGILPDLISYIRTRWDAAKRSKVQIEQEMVEAMRMRGGEYDPDKLHKIQSVGGSEAYFNLPETKCRAAKAWIEDILIQPGQKPWGIRPSPSPELSPIERQKLQVQIREAAINAALAQEMQTGSQIDIRLLKKQIDQAVVIAEAKITDAEMAQAQATAKKMETTIEDGMVEAKFTEELRLFIDDIVTFHCGILKGPYGRNTTKLAWKQTPAGYVPSVQPKITKRYRRVNPFNIYPAADSTGPQDSDLFERCRYSRREIEQMKGVPGYRSDAIDAVLYEHRNGGLHEWLWTDSEVDRVRNISQLSSFDTTKIDGIECYLSVPGSLLVEWNVPGVTEVTKEYEIIAVLIGRHLVFVTLNPHPLNARPYSVASMMKNPDGFWGRGIPKSIKHDCDAANMLYRSAINNAAMSAGPLVQEMVDRLAPGEIPGQIYPLKVYQTTDDMVGGTLPPVQFFNVPLTAHQLINVLKFVASMADEHSGIPAYAHGSEDVGGAGDTASGLSMLMNAAARGIKNVIRNIDEALESLVQRCYVWEMLYNPDQTIKGDLEVRVFGSSELLLKEQMLIRRKELLGISNNPVDLQIMGVEGRANLWKETLKASDIKPNEVLIGATNSPVVDPFNNQLNPQQQAMGGQQGQAQATDAAGRPAGGQDNALFTPAPSAPPAPMPMQRRPQGRGMAA